MGRVTSSGLLIGTSICLWTVISIIVTRWLFTESGLLIPESHSFKESVNNTFVTQQEVP